MLHWSLCNVQLDLSRSAFITGSELTVGCLCISAFVCFIFFCMCAWDFEDGRSFVFSSSCEWRFCCVVARRRCFVAKISSKNLGVKTLRLPENRYFPTVCFVWKLIWEWKSGCALWNLVITSNENVPETRPESRLKRRFDKVCFSPCINTRRW